MAVDPPRDACSSNSRAFRVESGAIFRATLLALNMYAGNMSSSTDQKLDRLLSLMEHFFSSCEVQVNLDMDSAYSYNYGRYEDSHYYNVNGVGGGISCSTNDTRNSVKEKPKATSGCGGERLDPTASGGEVSDERSAVAEEWRGARRTAGLGRAMVRSDVAGRSRRSGRARASTARVGRAGRSAQHASPPRKRGRRARASELSPAAAAQGAQAEQREYARRGTQRASAARSAAASRRGGGGVRAGAARVRARGSEAAPTTVPAAMTTAKVVVAGLR
ncbi:hypothetical protein Syun_009902 [Stephania yunnanensis]|uniref:Uncharacterized protein n=1 Tax=Stephania yunnanensis TaxID=152371 RepID=A0AAP0KH26_9MAGN